MINYITKKKTDQKPADLLHLGGYGAESLNNRYPASTGAEIIFTEHEAEDMETTTAADRRRQNLILFSICFASFMVNLDTYIVNISLPKISHYFNAQPQEVSWIILGYNLTVASLLIIMGRVGDKIGLKNVFQLGFALFTVSSLVCGLSPSLLVLIISRCVQGIGASMLYSMTPAMVPKFLPAERRGPAFGTLATAAALGITVGTPLGGIITGFLSWHWIFLINIPVGILAIVVCQKAIPDDSRDSLAAEGKGFDAQGAILSFICSMTMVFGISKGETYGWSSPLIMVCLAVAACSLYLFINWEGRAKDPLLDLSLFRDRAFTFGNSASVLAFAYLAGNNFIMPFYLINFKHMKAEQAGFFFLIYSVLFMFVGPFAGKLTNRISPRLLCTFAMALCSINALVFSFALSSNSLVPAVLYFILMAVSFGTFCPCNNTVVMGMAPPGKQGVVAGTYRMGNRLGMAIGVCFFQIFYSLAFSSVHHTGAISYEKFTADVLLRGFRDTYMAGGVLLFAAFMFSLLAKAKKSV